MADVETLKTDPQPDTPVVRKPDWLRVKAPGSPEYLKTRKLMRDLKLNTVCEEAACPNIGECWTQKHATVMILGDICTRACSFCNVATGMPRPVDPLEPEHVATAVGELALEFSNSSNTFGFRYTGHIYIETPGL